MIKIDDLSILDVAPKSTLTDETTRQIYEAINTVCRKIFFQIKNKSNIIDNLHLLTDEELNLLLWEFNIKNGEILERSGKIDLIKKGLLIHMQKGTVEALKNQCNLFFGSFEIKEWYQYGGEAGKFKIKTRNINKENSHQYILNVINEVKNVRSHLESIEFITDAKINSYIAIGVNSFYNYTVKIGG